MLALLNSIFSRFSANPSLTSAFPGGLHRDRAPEGTPMPYVVTRVVSSQTQFAYGPGSRSITKVRFSAYGIGHDATGTLIETLASAFDSALLTLSSGTNDSIVREGEPVPVLLKQDSQGNDVWEWSVTYDYGVVT